MVGYPSPIFLLVRPNWHRRTSPVVRRLRPIHPPVLHQVKTNRLVIVMLAVPELLEPRAVPIRLLQVQLPEANPNPERMSLVDRLLVQQVSMHPRIVHRLTEFPNRLPLQPELLHLLVCPNCHSKLIVTVLVPPLVLGYPMTSVRLRQRCRPIGRQLLALRLVDPSLVRLELVLPLSWAPRSRWTCRLRTIRHRRSWLLHLEQALRPTNLRHQLEHHPNSNWRAGFPILVHWFDSLWQTAHSSRHCRIDQKLVGLEMAKSPSWPEHQLPKNCPNFAQPLQEQVLVRHQTVGCPMSRTVALQERLPNFDFVVRRRKDLPRLRLQEVDPIRIHRHQGSCLSVRACQRTNRQCPVQPNRYRCLDAVHLQVAVAVLRCPPNCSQEDRLAVSNLDLVEVVLAS